MEGATLVLSRAEVAELLPLEACIEAVAEAFLGHARGETLGPAVLGLPAGEGGFHVKAAGLRAGGRSWFATKVNANFPANPKERGLPTIQGVIALSDAEDGRLLALLDSMEITALRTAAATAVAARLLARDDAHTAAVVGCGRQGRVQLQALARVRALQRVRVFDQDPGAAAAFARELGPALGVRVEVCHSPAEAARGALLCVTCTPARRALLGADDVEPGCFVAGVGADAAEKQELAPELLASATVVADHLEQCASIGDLHHALAAGCMRREDVHAELHEVVAGRRPGRTRPEEVVVFDSTGLALQDVAAAALVYTRACAGPGRLRVDLSH